MEGKIYFVDMEKRLLPMYQTAYADEADLQGLIAEYPDLLAGDQISPDSPRRWLHVAREIGVPGHQGGGGRWSIDNLFLDQDGIPTLVEVKRSENTQIRREVVGQLLEYAANVSSYWGVDHIRDRFEANCERDIEDPEQLVASLMEDEAVDYEGFWDKVSTNLRAGRLRLLFVADIVPPELRRIVEFLNEQMNPVESLAVELRQFASSDQRALVPTVIGITARGEATRDPMARTRQWDEQSFLEEMETHHGQSAVDTGRRLLEWIRPQVSRIFWGKGKTQGSFVPIIMRDGVKYQLFRCDTSRPSIQVYFAIYQDRRLLSTDDCAGIKDRLNEIPGVYLDRVEGFPLFDLLAITSDKSFAAFTGIYDEIIDLINERHGRSV